jgi:hypothetical protein
MALIFFSLIIDILHFPIKCGSGQEPVLSPEILSMNLRIRSGQGVKNPGSGKNRNPDKYRLQYADPLGVIQKTSTLFYIFVMTSSYL